MTPSTLCLELLKSPSHRAFYPLPRCLCLQWLSVFKDSTTKYDVLCALNSGNLLSHRSIESEGRGCGGEREEFRKGRHTETAHWKQSHHSKSSRSQPKAWGVPWKAKCAEESVPTSLEAALDRLSAASVTCLRRHNRGDTQGHRNEP